MKRLSFYKKGIHWYAKVPFIPETNCMMVTGANKLLNILAELEDKKDKQTVNFKLEYDPNKLCINLKKIESTLFGGAYYQVEYGELIPNKSVEQVWLCPVTLFALGHYPKNISINIAKQN